MRSVLVLLLLIVNQTMYSQFSKPPWREDLPALTTLKYIDSSIVSRTFSTASRAEGGIDTIEATYVTKYVYHYNDSSKAECQITESGFLRKSKRIGAWTIVRQDSGTKAILSTVKKYYFFDYELYFNYTFTKTIDVNVEQQTATCTFICYPGKDTALELRIRYWYTPQGIVMGRCETLQGKEIFTYQSDYLDAAFLALFDGHFNRKIFF